MTRSVRILAGCTLAALVAVTAYTAALGASGWLWLGWLVLLAVTVGVAMSRRT